MGVSEIITKLLDEKGITQRWVVDKMNETYPSLNMNPVKFSAIVTNTRKMTGDELLAFCQALKVSPDVFLQESQRE